MDFPADRNGAELVKLAADHELPAYVKAADYAALRDAADTLPDRVFADPVGRRYPCDSPAATWLSAAYYYTKKAGVHPKARPLVEQRLDAYARHWGVTADVAAVRDKAAALDAAEDAPPPDEDFALVVKAAGGGTAARSLPLTTAVEVKEAAEALLGRRDELRYAVRREAATRILEKAAALGAGLGARADEALERTAGRGVAEPAKVVDFLRKRAAASPDPVVRERYTGLASAVARSRNFCNPDNLAKLAEVVDQADRCEGLHRGYGDSLRRPEDVLFETPFTKAASELAGRVALTTGIVYDRDRLEKVSAEDLRSLFGDEFVRGVSTPFGLDAEKLAEVLPTLPRPDAELFEAAMAEAGLHPTLAKRASDVAVGLSDDVLRAWAEELTPSA